MQNDEVADSNEDKSRNMIDREPRIINDGNKEERKRMMKIWNSMKQLHVQGDTVAGAQPIDSSRTCHGVLSS